MELLKFLSCYTGSGEGREDLASFPAPEGPFKVKVNKFKIMLSFLNIVDRLDIMM